MLLKRFRRLSSTLKVTLKMLFSCCFCERNVIAEMENKLSCPNAALVAQYDKGNRCSRQPTKDQHVKKDKSPRRVRVPQ